MMNSYTRHIIERYNLSEKIEKLKVLVVGDVIIDKYTYCHVQGMMSKDMGYSARMELSEEYLGGTIAIARHISSFTDNITLMTMIGNEPEVKKRLEDDLAERMHLQLIDNKLYPTIVKHRYLSKNQKREEYRKIFAINNIPVNMQYEKEAYERFKKNLRENITNYDVVFLCDFGHGLVDKEVIDIMREGAKYLVLNCQTNSTNKGMNIITKYTRADVFTLDQQELKLAFPELAMDEKASLQKLCKHINGNGWLTRGSLGAYGIDGEEIRECPAFTLDVKDTIGAGDAFMSVAGLFAAAGAPIEVGTFVGNIAGALGANIVGNKDSIEKVNVLKYASTLMNI